MPLKNVKVLEFAGLAPGPFCGKILADFGATVTRIDKVWDNSFDPMQHGKRTLALDLKLPKAQKLVQRLSTKYDVIIDPFRPGIMEKLNLGPDLLCTNNPRLIFARLTGFGQSGRLAPRAGHDINYSAISGVLSMLGRSHEKPTPPINFLADFAGGGLMCALGICLALLERYRSGRGQVVDAAMIDGAAYVASWLFMSRSQPFWGNHRGGNLLDGGAYFYDTYETKDGQYMSVGAIEPQFFEVFKERLGLPQLIQFPTDDEESKKAVQKAFLSKTQVEWAKIFEDSDACVYPVLDWQKVLQHDHHIQRQSFKNSDGMIIPEVAPRMSRTPGRVALNSRESVNAIEETQSILEDLNLNKDEFDDLIDEHVVLVPKQPAKL